MPRILIVDDEPHLRRTLSQSLKQDGHVVCEAEDAATALQHLQESEFDVVVTDILLPGLGGVELLQRIRAVSPNVQVVMMTGSPTLETASASLRAGAVDYLSKPFTQEEILRTVANAARLKALDDTRRRLEAENRAHRENLEQLVEERTRQLRESEERYRQLVNVSPYAFYVHHDGRFLFANPAGCELLGAHDAGELIGKPILEVVHPDFHAVVQTRIRQALAAGQPVPALDEIFLRLDGTPVEVEVVATPMTYRGHPAMQVLARDVTERKQAEHALREAHDRLQQLSRRLVEVQEAERRSLARNLHDGLGQALTAAKLRLQSLIRFPDAANQERRLEESVATLDQLLQQVRKLSLELHPPMLDDLGLGAALRWLANQPPTAGMRIELTVPGDLPRFDPKAENAVFHIVQEALTNVLRHANARHARLAARVEAGRLHLSVSDDGVGFDVATARSRATRGESLGLLSMEERVALMYGELQIQSAPGEGTELRVWLPVTLVEPGDVAEESA